MITVYGTAKNPVAPAPNSSAGTATNVYAVYRSPPIRNQVIQVPELRPPRPHSSRWASVSGRRQRAATKPSALTARNRMVKTTISATWFLMPSPPVPGQLVHDRGRGHADDDEGKLQPVEAGKAQEL